MVGELDRPPNVVWETFIPIKPVPCPRPRVTKNGTFMPTKYKHAKQKHIDFLTGAFHKPTIENPVGIHMTTYIPRPKSVKRELPSVRPDIDNWTKTILDSLTQAGVLRDDCLVTDLLASKRYAENGKVGTELAIVMLS